MTPAKIKSLLVDLFFPRRARCMGCGSVLGCDRDDLCEDCRAKLARRWIGPRMPRKSLGLDGAAFAYAYGGPAGGMVRNLKFHGAWVLAEAMGADVARAVRLLRPEELDYVTAVPMHPKRLRERGRNHAEVLARSAAAHMDGEYRELLCRTRNTPQQARLSGRQRRRNVKDAFEVLPECREAIEGATILLIDDVYTTGSTAKNCVLALRRAGARRIYFAAYALGGGDERG